MHVSEVIYIFVAMCAYERVKQRRLCFSAVHTPRLGYS